MDYDKKMKAWEKYCAEQKLRTSISNPPVDRMLRRLGLRVSPFAFWNLYVVAISFGVCTTALLGGYLFTPFAETTAPVAIFTSISVGIVFGLTVVWFEKRERSQLNLPKWKAFVGS